MRSKYWSAVAAESRTVDAEQLAERLVEPEPRRRAAEQMIVLGERAPDLSRVGLDRAAVAARDAQLLERHALAVEHAENVVVRE